MPYSHLTQAVPLSVRQINSNSQFVHAAGLACNPEIRETMIQELAAAVFRRHQWEKTEQHTTTKPLNQLTFQWAVYIIKPLANVMFHHW